MAKTLVIKGADFEANKLATVTLVDPIYCKGISLDRSAASFSAVGATVMLTATVTPADTTEEVFWSTSNRSVATVSGGVVTVIGVGGATITAACGRHSAAFTITVAVVMNDGAAKAASMYLFGDVAADGGTGILGHSDTASRGAMLSSAGTLHLHNDPSLYPYVMPANTARVKFTFTESSDVLIENIFWLNHETAVSNSYPDEPKLIAKTGKASIAVSDGAAIVPVPSVNGYPEIDALAVCLMKTDYSTFTNEDFEKVRIEFLPAN